MTEINKEVFLKKEDLDLLYEVSTSIHSIQDLGEMLRNVLLKIKEVSLLQCHSGNSRYSNFGN